MIIRQPSIMKLVGVAIILTSQLSRASALVKRLRKNNAHTDYLEKDAVDMEWGRERVSDGLNYHQAIEIRDRKAHDRPMNHKTVNVAKFVSDGDNILPRPEVRGDNFLSEDAVKNLPALPQLLAGNNVIPLQQKSGAGGDFLKTDVDASPFRIEDSSSPKIRNREHRVRHENDQATDVAQFVPGDDIVPRPEVRGDNFLGDDADKNPPGLAQFLPGNNVLPLQQKSSAEVDFLKADKDASRFQMEDSSPPRKHSVRHENNKVTAVAQFVPGGNILPHSGLKGDQFLKSNVNTNRPGLAQFLPGNNVLPLQQKSGAGNDFLKTDMDDYAFEIEFNYGFSYSVDDYFGYGYSMSPSPVAENTILPTPPPNEMPVSGRPVAPSEITILPTPSPSEMPVSGSPAITLKVVRQVLFQIH
jgi:hypothetical protein